MITLVLCVLALFLLVNWVVKERRFRKEHKLLPGPLNLPIIGGLIQTALTIGEGVHHERFNRLCIKYGTPMMLKSGVQTFVIVSDYNTVKEVLCSNDWTSRFPSHERYREPALYKYLGLIMNVGESWKEVRRFTIRTLKQFGFGELNVSEQFIQEELFYLTKEIDRIRMKNNNEVYMSHFFKLPSLNIIWRVLAGHRLSYDDKKIQHIIECVYEITRLNIGLDLEWQFPILRFIPGFAHSRSKIYWFEQCFNLFQGIMDERRETGEYKISQSNFIDYFLQKIDDEKKNNSEFYTDEQFLVTCNDLLFTALDTTATALEWSILYMLVFPEIQRKVQEEIDTVIGTDRTPTMSDRIKMPYTEAVLLEVLRFANIVPVMSRTATCDTTLNGCFVPKDAMGILLFAVIHEDPNMWGDPETFRPERFLDENMQIINDQHLVAFGGGKRACIGYTMAKATWFMFFTTLLQRYKLSLSPNQPKPTLRPINGIVYSAQSHYCMMTLREISNTSEIKLK